MNQILLFLASCLLAGCGAMKPVEGATEVVLRDDHIATVHQQPDGSRLITVNRGEVCVAVILLMPPAKVVAVEAPVESPEKK